MCSVKQSLVSLSHDNVPKVYHVIMFPAILNKCSLKTSASGFYYAVAKDIRQSIVATMETFRYGVRCSQDENNLLNYPRNQNV